MFKYLYIAVLTFFFTVVTDWPFALALAVSTSFTLAWNWHEKKLDEESEKQESSKELPIYPK